MKKVFISIILILFTIISHAQLIVDVGNDTTFCHGNDADLLKANFIGSNVVVSGGVEPYTYSWSALHEERNYFYYASDFLSDTSISNPELTYFLYYDDLTFVLEVQDKDGLEGKDSLTVHVASFSDLLWERTIVKRPEDTVQFLVDGFIEPTRSDDSVKKITWIPAEGLSDAHDLYAHCFVQDTTGYSTFIEDNHGCISDTVFAYAIIVDPTLITEQHVENDLIEVSTFSHHISIENHTVYKVLYFQLYNLQGQLLKTGNLVQGSQQIHTSQINETIALIVVRHGKGIIFSKKVYLKR